MNDLCRSLPVDAAGRDCEIVTDDQMGGGGVREVVSAGVHDTYISNLVGVT